MSNETRLKVIQILKSIKDPQIPVNIWDLGLIYDLNIVSEDKISICMTLPSQNNAKRENLVAEIKDILEKQIPSSQVVIELVFEPAWSPEKMNEDAERALGIEEA